jgi:transcriptional regulator of acetoin/glycerol metabolism
MTSEAPGVPRTAAEWDRVRAAKHRVLAADPLTVDPADHPEVRPAVVRSWRRSMLAGVDPSSTTFPVDPDFSPGTRLAAVAQPILDRLRDQIADLSAWGFLTDRGCRLLTAVVGDFPGAGRVYSKRLRPGTCFAEDVVGTSGLGCAHEEQRAFLISGTEHFRTDSEVLTTTGVIIRDPFSQRYVGTLGVHCRREYGSAAVLPLVAELGRSIEGQLLASREDGEREFFDVFLRTQRRSRGPVVGVSRGLVVVSTRARELVHEADEEVLRRLAEETGTGVGRTVRRRLSSGVTVAIQVLPVRQARGEFAAVLRLEPVARENRADGGAGAESAVAGGRVPADPAPALEPQLARALAGGRPVLLTGERGTGKRHAARQALGLRAAEIVELDAALAALDPDRWLREAAAALRDGTSPVLLGHVTDLPVPLLAPVADLVSGARVPVVGTAADDRDQPAADIQERFPVLLTAPPLRERPAELAGLCAAILADLAVADGRSVSIAPRAVAALLAGDWPGNIRQLLQVLASARIRTEGTEIGPADLPTHHRGGPAGRARGELERVERQALLVALRETGGNRDSVAERLGISRATVYRKLKRYELH